MNVCNETIYLDQLQNNPGVEKEGGLGRGEAERSRVETEGWVCVVYDTVLSALHIFFGSKLK